MQAEPGKPPYYDEIPNELEILQKTVDGYIETVTLASDLVVICNEEGRLLANAYNCRVAGVDFVGTFILAGVEDDDFGDIPEALRSEETLQQLFPGLYAAQRSSSVRVCPVCGREYSAPPAISRKNRAEICPDCGQSEALEEYWHFVGLARREARS